MITFNKRRDRKVCTELGTLQCNKLRILWTSPITLYITHQSLCRTRSPVTLLQNVLLFAKHRHSLPFRKIPNVCKRSTKGSGEARRETRGWANGYKGKRVYVRLYLRIFYVSPGSTSSIFNLVSIPLIPLMRSKISKGRNRARAITRASRKKNCARKSGVVERITLINWWGKTYLLTLYWEWRTKVSANLCSK